jgi:hypothetical protein
MAARYLNQRATLRTLPDTGAPRAQPAGPNDRFRYQLIYRPIFQFEVVFVRWRAESSILFSFDTH